MVKVAVKVALFFETTVKVKNGKNSVLTFPNGFLDLYRLLPTFRTTGKVDQTTTFQLFPPIYRGKVKKLMVPNGKNTILGTQKGTKDPIILSGASTSVFSKRLCNYLMTLY